MPGYIITIVCAIFASTGFWALVTKVLEKKSASAKMLLGLGHDRIIAETNRYIERGYISSEEYENLYKYLYTPYKNLGGNGSAERNMELVKKLPTHIEEE